MVARSLAASACGQEAWRHCGQLVEGLRDAIALGWNMKAVGVGGGYVGSDLQNASQTEVFNTYMSSLVPVECITIGSFLHPVPLIKDKRSRSTVSRAAVGVQVKELGSSQMQSGALPPEQWRQTLCCFLAAAQLGVADVIGGGLALSRGLQGGWRRAIQIWGLLAGPERAGA